MPKIQAKSAAERLPGLGAAIREVRQKNGYGLELVAAAVGVHLSALSKIERGERLPTLPVVVAIAAEFGVTVDSLVARAAEITSRD